MNKCKIVHMINKIYVNNGIFCLVFNLKNKFNHPEVMFSCRSRFNVRPASSKFASTCGRRQVPSGMAKSDKSAASVKQYQVSYHPSI